ncbi:MAG: T9SS type A sorting domain-containing protein [Ignavibacteria bacterium]|nr:T9SS type A sorting domain-containing protein [Ignavibacteria bacterium]
MKRLLLLIMLLIPVFSEAQDISVANAIPSGFQTVQNPDWGMDALISANEPTGNMSGLVRQNGDYYLAVADTLSTTNVGLVVFRSTNQGLSWNLLAGGVQPKAIFRNLKMVATGNDSLYVFFMYGTDIYRWNIINNSFGKFTADSLIRSYDVVTSSTGSIYVFYDRNYNANIRRIGSIDGGFTWAGSGSVTSAGVYPKLYMSGSGDTLVLNYYGPVLSDTATSVIRAARYRETAPGTMASSGFQDVVTSNVPKTEYASVMKSGIVWFVYTTGLTGAIDIKCALSTNSGTNYNAPIDIAANPNVDEYWFSARHYTGGFEIAYYSDSLQSGPPTNNSDKIGYKFAQTSAPGFFGAITGISNHPPGWSPRMYKPVSFENLANGNYGVAWVGFDGTAKKIYFDGNTLTNLRKNQNEIANDYSLSQNYPNPFNPVTKINFSIPKSGFVTLIVFDILGREVSNILSKSLNQGSYTVDFDGSKLTSGVYFYKIEVNGYSDIKKMMLVK